VDPRVQAELDAYAESDEELVERLFREVLRRPPEEGARERAVRKLAEGTLSRATLVYELASSPEHARVRQLDDAVALGLGARARGERIRWLQAPPATDERVVELPWVLSRLVPAGRVLEVGYAFAEPAYLAALLRSGVELVGVDLATREVEGMERVDADVRELPFGDGSFDQALLVSTLEHVGADTTRYGVSGRSSSREEPRERALRELRRVLRADASLLVTVPLGEPGDYGWFRQEDERGWTRLFARASFFLEELELYELTPEGWRANPALDTRGVRYGQRGPAASAVLCAELRPGRLRRIATPAGLVIATRRRARRLRHRARRARPVRHPPSGGRGGRREALLLSIRSGCARA
jgi:SAM-dependent methyltransferase